MFMCVYVVTTASPWWSLLPRRGGHDCLAVAVTTASHMYKRLESHLSMRALQTLQQRAPVALHHASVLGPLLGRLLALSAAAPSVVMHRSLGFSQLYKLAAVMNRQVEAAARIVNTLRCSA